MRRILKVLLLVLAIVLLCIAIVLFLGQVKEKRYVDMQKHAALRMQEAEDFLKTKVLEKGIPIEADDVNATGLVGPEFTELTSTPGNPEDKRSALNPNFAGAIVRYYTEAGLKRGDVVAIGTTGSFPGFTIAALIAATELKLETRVIASLGSSMHGATRPEFTIFDMLNYLQSNGFAEFDLLAVSPGGINDHGGGLLDGVLWFNTKELSEDICRGVGKEIILYDDLADNIQRRLEIFGDDVDLFVNVGGAGTNCGTTEYTLDFPRGLVLDVPFIPDDPYRGLNYEFVARGIPVLALLNTRGLAEDSGVAYDPIPMEAPGTGAGYIDFEYRLTGICILIVIALLSLVCCIFLWRSEKKKGRT